jgi:hypothetical protein
MLRSVRIRRDYVTSLLAPGISATRKGEFPTLPLPRIPFGRSVQLRRNPHNSKLDGVTGRISTTNLHRFQAYWTFGHTRATTILLRLEA